MIGKKISLYHVTGALGAGGMGEVYRATDTRLDRDVALKVLPAGALADKAARKRFCKEALALSKLNHSVRRKDERSRLGSIPIRVWGTPPTKSAPAP